MPADTIRIHRLLSGHNTFNTQPPQSIQIILIHGKILMQDKFLTYKIRIFAASTMTNTNLNNNLKHSKNLFFCFADSNPYVLLDGLRGVAALLVIWYHVFEALPQVPSIRNSIMDIWLSISSLFCRASLSAMLMTTVGNNDDPERVLQTQVNPSASDGCYGAV